MKRIASKNCLSAGLALSFALTFSAPVLAQETKAPAEQTLDFSKPPNVDPDKKPDVLTPKTDDTSGELKAKPFVLPDNAKIQPQQKKDTKTGVHISDEQKKGYSAVTQCVRVSQGDRSFLGRSELKFTNVCAQPVNVAARICVEGKSDRMEVFTLGDKGGLFGKYDSHSEQVSHAKSSAPVYKYNFCKGESCTPQMPLSCESF